MAEVRLDQPAQTREQLRDQARLLGLSVSGTKDEIEARIEQHLTSAAAGEHYTLGTWAGRPNYQCRYCTFASLRKRRTIMHVAEEHGGLI